MKTLLRSLLVVSLFFTMTSWAANVGPAGYSESFGTRPAVGDWSTRSITGGASGAADSTTALQMDTNIAVIASTSVTNLVLDMSPLNPPGSNAVAMWTSAGGAYLQTRPTGVRITLLMATLVNNTGSNVTSINLGYTLTLVAPVTEEVRGQRVYTSLTGAAGSWTNIAAPAVAGPVTATLNVNWLAGARLYVLIADDNASGTPDEACQVDDFFVTTSGGVPVTTAIVIASPTDGQSIVENANFTVTTTTSGAITGTDFYLDGAIMGSDATAPYSVTFSNVTVGPHTITVVANSTVFSSPVHITVTANNPPSVALTTAPGGTVLVGSNIVNTAVVTDSDPGGSIQRVDFYVDNDVTPRFTDTTSPYTFELCDVLVGTHKITAVAVDHAGARGSNFNTLTATNPANVIVIVPNGSTWKYFDKGDAGAGGVPWAALAFDDSGWSNGVAELGYGDSGNNRPETTVVGYGPSATTKYITTYFRKSINVPSPGSYTNLIFRLLRDDGAVVYLNGTEVFRSYMTNGVVTNGTLAGLAGAGPAAADDGTFYVVTNVGNTLLSGNNVLGVEVHQDALNSSDISFDLMLWGQGAVGPTLTITRTDDTHADVRWPVSAATAAYVLKSKNDLNAAVWNPVLEPDVPDATSHHVIINTSSGKRFLRLEGP
ncbi:MAG: hypothetical protein QOF48_2845 [Verrucomicrobiota bacterium]|jgi:hypothetical protein